MAELLKHLCSSCGGPLIIDTDAQLYRCPYCGVTYDYAYFDEEDALSKGMTALRRGEFRTAAEVFDFILAKDPHDFLALRGRLLAKAKVTGVKELNKTDVLLQIPYDKVRAEAALEAAAEEDKAYFTKLMTIFNLGEEYAQADKDEKDADLAKRRQASHYDAVAARRQESGIPIRSENGVTMMNPIVFAVIAWLVCAVCLVVALASKDAEIIAMAWGGVAVFGVGGIFGASSVGSERKYANQIEGLNEELEGADRKLSDIRDKKIELLKSVRKEYVELRRIDPELKSSFEK